MKRELKWVAATWEDAEYAATDQKLIPILGGFIVDFWVDKYDDGDGAYEAYRFIRGGKVEMTQGRMSDLQDAE